MTTTTRTNYPRTLAGAERAWPAALAQLENQPDDRNLQQLCTLLDVMDTEIVKAWKTDGHDDRIRRLNEYRGIARHANARVSAHVAQSAAARAQATNSKRWNKDQNTDHEG